MRLFKRAAGTIVWCGDDHHYRCDRDEYVVQFDGSAERDSGYRSSSHESLEEAMVTWSEITQ
jgi:hypothetical protein